MEEILIKNVQNAIRAIKLGLKTPEESNIGVSLNKLKPLNEGMYQELLAKYMIQLTEYKSKQK